MINVYELGVLKHVGMVLFGFSEGLYLEHDALTQKALTELDFIDDKDEISNIIDKDFYKFASTFNESSLFSDEPVFPLEKNTALTFFKRFSPSLNDDPSKILADIVMRDNDSILTLSRYARCLARLYFYHDSYAPIAEEKTIIGLDKDRFFCDLEYIRHKIILHSGYLLGTHGRAGALLDTAKKRIDKAKVAKKTKKQMRINEVMREYAQTANDPTLKRWFHEISENKLASYIKAKVDPYLKSNKLSHAVKGISTRQIVTILQERDKKKFPLRQNEKSSLKKPRFFKKLEKT